MFYPTKGYAEAEAEAQTTMKVHRYSLEARAAIRERLAKLVKNGVKKSEIELATGIRWQSLHRICKGTTLPHPFTCTVLETYLERKEKERVQ